MKEQSNGMFFVQLRQPTEVRRHILETLRDIVEILQKFEKFKHMRHQKLENIQKLRGLLKDANKMLGNLKNRLPQTNLRAVVVKEIKQKAKKIHHKKKGKAASEEKGQKAPKKEKTELERLEAELGAIESKLKSLA